MTFFFNFVSNNTKDIFEIVSDWNDVISFITTMVGVAVAFFSSFCFIKIINMEDINNYTFKDTSEKNRYAIFKTTINIFTTLLFSCVLAIIIMFISLPNTHHVDSFSTYYFVISIFFITGFAFINYKILSNMLLSIPFCLPKRKGKNNFIFCYCMTFIPVPVILFIAKFFFKFNDTTHELFYSISSIYLVLIFIDQEEDNLFAKNFGVIFITVAMLLIPGFLYNVKGIQDSSAIKNSLILSPLYSLDDIIDKYLINLSIDNYFIIACIAVLSWVVIFFWHLHNKLSLDYFDRQNLAYFYAKIKGKKVFIYGKLDNYFICNTKDYIKCSHAEQKEGNKKLIELKSKEVKNIAYEGIYNNLVEDMFYYIKYFNTSENEIKKIFGHLEKIAEDTGQNSNIRIEKINKLFRIMDQKINLLFIAPEEFNGNKIYNYHKNIKKFNDDKYIIKQ